MNSNKLSYSETELPELQDNRYDDCACAMPQMIRREPSNFEPILSGWQSTTLRKIKPPLEAWLFLTRACNLTCAHCYVSKSEAEMTLETGLQAVERLFQLAEQDGYPGVKIKYAGGEPTLRWELITALHAGAVALSLERGLALTEILVSNGTTLSRARLESLKAKNIHLSISLDDFGSGHDPQRPFSNGQPSFNRVLRTLEMALELGLAPYLTFTITRLNLEDLPAVTAFALQNHLFLNWNFYRPDQVNDPLVAEEEQLIGALQKGLQGIRQNLPNYPFLDKLIDRSNFGAAHTHACGAGRNYLSIDCDGRVLPCHMLSGANRAGTPLDELSQVRFDTFANPAVSEKAGCKTCEWRTWCAGGCPILAERAQEFGQALTPYCHVYKAIFPELMKLKGLQLLAVA